MKFIGTTKSSIRQERTATTRLAVVLNAVAVVFCAWGLSAPAVAETIDDVIGRCPTVAEMAAIDAVVTVSFEGNDPSAPTLVCHSAQGSRDLTKLKRNLYNILRAAQKIRFTQPLPWSAQTSIWDWLRLESGINMIRIRGDLTGSFCCDPPNAIDLHAVANTYYTFSDKWVDDNGDGGGLVSALALVVHEARHRKAGGHTCGSDDQTLTELGAWGAQIYYYYWLDHYSDRDFFRPNSGDPAYYRNWAAQEAESTRGRICSPPPIVTGTVVEFYNSILNHYFMTISPAEAAAIDNGSAGPGWLRTGVAFKAWPDQTQAPLHVRPVCRFYGSISPGPNSHFYTVDPDECASLKQLQATTPPSQPRWNYEGTAFYIGGVVRGTPAATSLYCGGLRFPGVAMNVSRFYNKRAAQVDSNHRYTVTQAATNQMAQAGWSAEGLVMCSMQ